MLLSSIWKKLCLKVLISGLVVDLSYVEDEILKKMTTNIKSLLFFVIKSKPRPKLEI